MSGETPRTDGGQADDDRTNDGQQFDRVPETPADREVEGRASRREILDWWDERFDVPAATFDGITFWEKGAGKIWAFAGEVDSPVRIEGLGMTFMRTRQEHWKPTTEAAQRFGADADRNVIRLSREEAERFVAGEDQELDWDGDWGYLITAHESAGEDAPLGVGLYLHGELRSRIPKGRRREF